MRRIIQKIKEGKLKKLLAEMLWMYIYVRRYWMLILLYIALGSMGSVLGLGTSVVSRDLVDAVTGVSSAGIARVAFLYVGVGVSQIFINAVQSRMSTKIRLKVTNEIKADIYEQVLRTDWAYVAGYRSGDLLYRVNGDAGMVANSILTFLPNVVSTLISFGGAFVIVMQNDPMMALIALAGAPVSFLSSRYMTRKMREMQKENQEMASAKTVFDQETFQNLQFIKAFGMIDRVTEKFHALQQESMDIALRQNKFQSGSMVITSLIGQVIGYACYGFAAYRLWQGEISYGTMTMFVGMAGSLRGSFSGLLGLIPTALRAGISAERIMEIVSLPRESMEDEDEARQMKERGKEQGIAVCMRQVDFQYEENKWVYQHADFEANPGEIVALIGPSGQGKTTTLRLFLGLYHPQRGSVTVNNPGGSPLEVSSSTRCLFSYIPQGNTMFSGSIAENMRMVRPQATDEEIKSVLKTACAWEFVERLENGIDTQVMEQGRRFSEGQKQRLSIARALLADAPVMILDEATSALDVATERRLLRNIIKKEPCRTVIVAAHRPSVFELCSRVYKIQGGNVSQVNEQGIREFLEAF
ncbi:MAG: ABC transporter ATP-binding protein [Lachnospiraceae bacterium]